MDNNKHQILPKPPPTHTSAQFLPQCWILTQSILLRPQHSSAAPTSDPAPEKVQSELTAVLSPDSDNFTPSPTSPLYLGKNCTTQEVPV